MSEREDRIVLVDEEGLEHSFTLYRIVEVDDAAYALLEPDESDGELVILRIEGDEDEQVLVTLSDDEWERVAEALEGMEDLLDDSEEL